jgi:acetamidase/formamidase
VERTTAVLPVYQSGALLFIGKGHALHRDGEPIGNGVETSIDVESRSRYASAPDDRHPAWKHRGSSRALAANWSS